MKNHCEESVGFSVRASVVSAVILFMLSSLRSMLYFDLLAIFMSNIMILLAFPFCFLVFTFVKDQIACFQLKQVVVFLN